MDAELPALLRAEIVRRFSEHGPALGEGDRIATFKCPSGAIGDVVIDVDGPGVVVEISGMTHGHFDQGSPEEVVEACASFLTDLFDDEVVVWVSATGGSGGWFYRSFRSEGPPSGSRAGTWSGPLGEATDV